MSTGIKSRRRRKRYEEWEKRALTGVAEGDDASDTRGVILIVAERMNSSASAKMSAKRISWYTSHSAT
jgi:hypothetical protein